MSVASLAVLASALVAFDAFLYASFSGRLTGDLHHQLTERAQLARTLASSLAPQQLADRLASGGISAQITKNGQRYVARPPAAPAAGKRPHRPEPPGALPARPPRPAAPGISAHALTLTQPLPGGERLVLSADRSQLESDLAGLLVLEVAGTLVVLLLAAVVLWRVLGRALAPLDHTTAVAAAIARGQARRRLSPRRTDTELGRMATAFDAMLDRLQDALQAAQGSEGRMRQFLGDAAHELRTPIQAIQAGAETLLRNHDVEQRERFAVQIVRDAARAGRLVEDLLALNRLDRNPELELSRVDLAELAREQLARAEVLAPRLRLRYAGPVRWPIDADRDRICQVIVNLLDNARHATPDGGRITLTIDDAGAGASLTVTDSGPGIPAEARERIFERFVRLDASRARDAFGSGLGLAIARGIAEAHGGTLRCTANPSGTGARFELTLPRSPRIAGTSGPPADHGTAGQARSAGRNR
ncbi:MAG TPA: HAMP domain-containing sensor histidine kinase [Solirubrobacteraceae bacterium]|nr:HAMP domain-containing sensor histidine kinase [Solirubrobacteraceae bacterium]